MVGQTNNLKYIFQVLRWREGGQGGCQEEGEGGERQHGQGLHQVGGEGGEGGERQHGHGLHQVGRGNEEENYFATSK